LPSIGCGRCARRRAVLVSSLKVIVVAGVAGVGTRPKCPDWESRVASASIRLILQADRRLSSRSRSRLCSARPASTPRRAEAFDAAHGLIPPGGLEEPPASPGFPNAKDRQPVCLALRRSAAYLPVGRSVITALNKLGVEWRGFCGRNWLRVRCTPPSKQVRRARAKSHRLAR